MGMDGDGWGWWPLRASRPPLTRSLNSLLLRPGERRRQAARRDRRAAEASATVQAALASTALLHLLPPGSRLDVAVQVLQADGGSLAVAITAAGAALADAGIPMRGVIGAAASTALEGAALLDPNQAETGAGGAAVLVAAHAGALAAEGGGGGVGATGGGGNAIIAWQVDGGPAAGVEEVEGLTGLAADGAAAVGGLVRAALFASAARCAAGRAGVASGRGLGAQADAGGGGGDAEMVGA